MKYLLVIVLQVYGACYSQERRLDTSLLWDFLTYKNIHNDKRSFKLVRYEKKIFGTFLPQDSSLSIFNDNQYLEITNTDTSVFYTFENNHIKTRKLFLLPNYLISEYTELSSNVIKVKTYNRDDVDKVELFTYKLLNDEQFQIFHHINDSLISEKIGYFKFENNNYIFSFFLDDVMLSEYKFDKSMRLLSEMVYSEFISEIESTLPLVMIKKKYNNYGCVTLSEHYRFSNNKMNLEYATYFEYDENRITKNNLFSYGTRNKNKYHYDENQKEGQVGVSKKGFIRRKKIVLTYLDY